MIRPATQHDAGACAVVLRAWIDETPWMPSIHLPSDDLPFLRRVIANQQVWVVDEARRIKGFLALNGETVSCLYIAGGARRQGLGTALLERAREVAEGLTVWTHAANEPAQAFYRKHGFVAVERTAGDNEERLPDICFKWLRGKVETRLEELPPADMPTDPPAVAGDAGLSESPSDAVQVGDMPPEDAALEVPRAEAPADAFPYAEAAPADADAPVFDKGASAAPAAERDDGDRGDGDGGDADRGDEDPEDGARHG